MVYLSNTSFNTADLWYIGQFFSSTWGSEQLKVGKFIRQNICDSKYDLIKVIQQKSSEWLMAFLA